MRSRIRVIPPLLLAAALLVACGQSGSSGSSAGSSSGGTVAVGGSNFTESTILANIYADVLKSAGFDASVQAVGNRDLYLKALEAGQIQAFPEYLATVTEALNAQVNGANPAPVASGDVD